MCCYTLFLANILAVMAPLMLCHTLNTAPGMVARGKEAKWIAASEEARPLFCMPTSMLMAMHFSRENLSRRPMV